jgi:hypothetical protein
VRRLALLLGIALVAAACGGGEDATVATPTTTASTQATTAGPKLSPRCIEAPTVIANAIGSGLKKKRWTLADVYAVKTTAYGSVFFVSGRIEGAPASPIGTWATNNLNLGGLMFSVDPAAKRLSKWPDGSSFEAKLTLKVDGARESRACVRQASG